MLAAGLRKFLERKLHEREFTSADSLPRLRRNSFPRQRSRNQQRNHFGNPPLRRVPRELSDRRRPARDFALRRAIRTNPAILWEAVEAARRAMFRKRDYL